MNPSLNVIKSSHSQSSVVSNAALHSTKAYLPKPLFKTLKHIQNKEAAKIAEKLKYKPGLAACLHLLINCSNTNGITRVTLDCLAEQLRLSVSTIGRYMDRFASDGLIKRKKMGWKQSNTTILLFVQHLNCNKYVKMKDNLNALESGPWPGTHRASKKQKKEGEAGFADASGPPQDAESAESAEIWDDEIEVRGSVVVKQEVVEITEEEKAMVREKLRQARAMLNVN